MRIAYSYIRFSSAAQAKGNSQRRQTERSQAWCERNGCVLDDSLNLRDLGVSAFRGTNMKEGALAGFLEACRTRRVRPGSVLIVESLDRLSRQEIQPALRLFLSILESGVSIVTLQPEREYTPGNPDPMTVIEAVLILCRANEESTTKSSRVRDSWNQRRKLANQKPMTAKCPAWLELTPQGFVEIKAAADAVRRIFELCNEGLGVHRITKQMVDEGVRPFGKTARWNMPYVRKILTFRAVYGEHQPYVLENGKRVPVGPPLSDYYPPVVSEVDFYKAQQMLGVRRNKQGRTGHADANLFTGLVYHAADKTTMVLKRPTGGEQKYLYLTSSAYLHGKKSVGVRSFPYLPFEQAVLSFLTELRAGDVMDPKTVDGKCGADAEMTKLSEELLVIERKLERANTKAREVQDFEPYLDLIRALGEDKKRKSDRLEQLKTEAAVDRAEALGDAKSLVTMLAAANGDDLATLRRRIKGRLLSLVKEIWVLIEKHGGRRVMLAQVYLHSGVVRDITIYHPALKPGECRPQVRTPAGVDLRNYAAESAKRVG